MSDYSEDELMQFQKQFAPVPQKIHHLKWRIGIIYGLFFGLTIISIIVVIILKKDTSDWLDGFIPLGLLLSIILSVFFVWIPFSRLEKCPACHNSLLNLPLSYCPECGNLVDKSNWLSGPKCNACGKSLTSNKGPRHYKIRYCRHCGIFLDEKGFCLKF